MSPDDNGQQSINPLPEVPQIQPTKPVTPQPAPVAENIPEVTPVYSAPTVIEPIVPPIPAVTEAPISQPVPSATPPSPQPASPVMAPTVLSAAPVFNDIAPTQSPVTPRQTNPSPFSNTPVFDDAPASGPTTPTSSMPVLGKKKGRGLLLGLIAGGVIVLAGLTAVFFLFILPNSGRVSEADLVSSTTDGTSYLRPKQWQTISESGVSGYGDKLAKDGKSTAAIFIKKGSYLSSNVKNATDSQLSTFRQSITAAYSSTKAESTLKESGSCASVSDINTTASSAKSSNSIGIFQITATCVKDGANYKMIYYALLGNDGYARTVFLMASESNWQMNEAVFKKMIDSVDQG